MGSWCYGFMRPFLQRTFPRTRITYDQTQTPDLVIRSLAPRLETLPAYNCPYILFSGESMPATPLMARAPLFEINTVETQDPKSVYIPYLIAEVSESKRPNTATKPKKYCAAYAFSNPVPEREAVFRTMKAQEKTCYSFGTSCRSYDVPFRAPAKLRVQNASAFADFGFVVAMENKVAPGYLTEKIGYAFGAGSVPIYWGDTDTVSTFFNPASFLNVGDYASPEAAATAAVEIWRDRQKLQRFLDAPLRLNGRLADYEAIYTEYRPWQKLMMDLLRDEFPDLS